MYAVEFQASVKDGAIEIPQEYQQELGNGSAVKVIVLMPQQKPRDRDIMDELTENPISVKGLPKLTRNEIYDRQ
jgi:hypothetical protein